VPDRILTQVRGLVRTRRYVVTLHAEEEMDNDGLTVVDVERSILTGEIVERQQDHDTGEWKLVVTGQTTGDKSIGIVTKLSVTGKVVIITVYRV